MKARTIEKVITKVNLDEKNNDFAYWQSKSYGERIKTLEEIRQEYSSWK